MKRWAWWVGAGVLTTVVVALAVVFWAPWDRTPAGLAELRDADPHGAAACEVVANWLNGELAGTDKADVMWAAGLKAGRSSTEEIRATAGESVDLGYLRSETDYDEADFQLANLRELHAACEHAGVDMPEYVEQD